MFECLVCGQRTVELNYGVRYDNDFIPLCSRRCRRLFANDPIQYMPTRVELGSPRAMRHEGRDPRF